MKSLKTFALMLVLASVAFGQSTPISGSRSLYYVNDVTTGTVRYRLATGNGSPSTTAVVSAPTDALSSVVGICDDFCGISGSAWIANSGLQNCIFDNATIANDTVAIGTGGACHDTGSRTAPGIAIVQSTNASAGTYQVVWTGASTSNTGGGTLGYTAENVANKGATNGYAGLDGTGKVPSGQLPPASGSGATSTAGLTDWTNAGIATGYVPMWSSVSSKWTAVPGVPVSDSTSTTVGDIVVYGGITGKNIMDSGVKANSLLPLAGGTLTGPLAGTSATFSGSVAVGTAVLGKSVWARQGVVLPPTTLAEGTSNGEVTVLYEGNSQLGLGAGNVFKAWYSCVGSNVCYAESLDGLSSWVKQSPAVVTNHARSYVVHSGSTYYFFGAAYNSNTWNTMDLYTSADGLNFTLAAANILTLGTGTTWDSKFFGNMAALFDGTTWRMLYEAEPDGGPWTIGVATTTDVTARTGWTKYSGNPVLGSAAVPTGGPMLWKNPTTGKYWCWAHQTPPIGLPSDGVRYVSSDFINWSQNPALITYPRMSADEGSGIPQGQVADLSLVEANGKTYLYYTAMAYQGYSPVVIKGAVANMTMAQLTATDEGAGQSLTPQFTGNTDDVPVYTTAGGTRDGGVNLVSPDEYHITMKTSSIHTGFAGNVGVDGLSMHTYRGSGWPYFFRVGMNSTSGNQSILSQNYNPATGAIDDATKPTTIIVMDGVAGTVCMGTGAINTAPACQLTVANAGITNIPIFYAGATFGASSTASFSGVFKVKGWTFTWPTVNSMVAVTPGVQAFGYAGLSSGTVTVSNSAACVPSATCVYKLTGAGLNGSTALGVLNLGTVVAGTSFVINSLSSAAAVVTGDTRFLSWQIN